MPTKLISSFALIELVLLFTACSKKTILPKPTHTASFDSSRKTPTAAATPPAYIPPLKTTTAKVIVVNDKVASKAVNGRYYYDLEGKRYWRKNRDGKYYLYYKGMFDNKDFQ